jgi:hypothetical protein
MKQDTVTSNAAGAWGGVLAITTLACGAQVKGANLLAVLIFLTGCAQETLFQSNFDQTPTGVNRHQLLKRSEQQMWTAPQAA